MKRKIRSVMAILAMTLVVWCTAISAYAATGTITIQLEDGASGTSKAGVVFSCEKVADMVDGDYILMEPFKDSKVDLNQTEYAKDLEAAAETLSTYATKKGVRVTTDKKGTANIKELEPGVYFLSVVEQNKYDKVAPTLVSIPTWDEAEKQMQYDITVIPKHSPNPSNAPQTGDGSQLLLCCGAVVITGGICIAILLLRKKK